MRKVTLLTAFPAPIARKPRKDAGVRALARTQPQPFFLTSVQRNQEIASDQGFMAVTVGFEPTVGGYPTQLFESCTFGRSDTSPRKSLRHVVRRRESGRTRGVSVELSAPGAGESSVRPIFLPSRTGRVTQPSRSAAPAMTSTTRSGSVIPVEYTYVAVKPRSASPATTTATVSGVDSGFTPIIAVFSMPS